MEPFHWINCVLALTAGYACSPYLRYNCMYVCTIYVCHTKSGKSWNHNKFPQNSSHLSHAGITGTKFFDNRYLQVKFRECQSISILTCKVHVLVVGGHAIQQQSLTPLSPTFVSARVCLSAETSQCPFRANLMSMSNGSWCLLTRPSHTPHHGDNDNNNGPHHNNEESSSARWCDPTAVPAAKNKPRFWMISSSPWALQDVCPTYRVDRYW